MAKGGFRGMPGGMNQAAMMKQAQKMQQEMLRMQEEMETKTWSATAGGGCGYDGETRRQSQNGTADEIRPGPFGYY